MMMDPVNKTNFVEPVLYGNANWLDPEDQLLSDEAYLICGVYLTILGLVAFVGNVFVLLVLTFGRPNFLKIHTIMLFSISTADLIIACVAYPLTAISSYRKRWIFGDVACVTSGFVVYFLIMCNINSLCAMAICRYIIVCRPDLEQHIGGRYIKYIVVTYWSWAYIKYNLYQQYIRGRYIKYIVVTVWLYALFWTGTPLVGWSSYVQESFGTSCTLDWDGTTTADLSYNFLCVVFCYMLPVALFMFCYYNVAKSTMLRNSLVYGRGPHRQMTTTPSDRAMEEINRKMKLRASRHMNMICLVMIASFVITWTPYALLTFINIISTPVSPEVQVLPTMFAKLSCVANPIIYCGLCDRFRDAAARLFSFSNQIRPLLLPERAFVARSQQTEDVTVLNLADIRASTSHHNKRAHNVIDEAVNEEIFISSTVDSQPDSGNNGIQSPDSICSTSSL